MADILGDLKINSALDSALYHCLDEATNEKYLAALHEQVLLQSRNCVRSAMGFGVLRAASVVWQMANANIPAALKRRWTVIGQHLWSIANRPGGWQQHRMLLFFSP